MADPTPLNCASCGAANPAGRRFCDSCGQPLAAGCPSCGQPNRPDARFCGNCGTALTGATPAADGQAASAAASPPGQAERRLVSVLFADLVGFTPFAEERDPELVREALSRYFDVAREVVERHGGTVEKFIGDAVMAVWGAPLAREDDAERAVRAALELLAAVRRLEGGLEARAAVLSGEAAVSPGASGQGLLAGDMVNTAARLQAAAPPGTVLVGESTMRSASRAVAFEPAGDLELKGKSAPVPAWRALRVVAERGGRVRTDTLEPPFVGRDAEIALLKDLLHATTREGRARLVAVTGPAGIGKSRLAWELEKYLDGLVEGIYWHRGRSPSYGEGITFWALGEMVRRRCGLAEDDDDATTRARVGATVAEFVPAAEDRAWVEPSLLALLGVAEPPAGGRDVLFSGWRIFFERIAARGTTVLLFEDLHFADSGLLDFIDHLLEWTRNAPILVLALARPELLEKRPTFGSATRHFHSLPLEPLADEHMLELLAGLVPDLPADAARAIVARADGIPLYAVETVRMLIGEGKLAIGDDGTTRPVGPLGELAIPDTLRSLIASRLDALEPGDRGLLQFAAVLGQTFTVESLSAVTGIEPETLVGRLRALVRQDILSLEADPRSPERGQYGFVQGLIREVAYGTLARRERRERHLAAARHYETLADDEVAGALATHYLAAYRASDEGPEADAVAIQARLALRGAAERAGALGAPEQAVGHLRRALEVTADPLEQADLLERAAAAADAAGAYADAERFAVAAIEIHGQHDQPLAAARVAGQLGSILINDSRMTEAVDVLAEAISGLGDSAPDLTAALESGLARVYMRTDRLPEAIAAADRALVIAEPRALVPVVAEALTSKGSALGFLGRPREAGALVAAALRLAEQAGVPSAQLRAFNNLAVVIVEDDQQAGIRLYEQALELARRVGERGYVNFLTPNLAFQYVFAGRQWDVALAMLEERYEAAGSDSDRARQLNAMLPIHIWRGEPSSAAEIERFAALLAGTDDPVSSAALELHRCQLALVEGRLADAHAAGLRSTAIYPSHYGGVVHGFHAAFWARDLDRARQLQALLPQMVRTGHFVSAFKQAAEAGVAALEGRAEDAVAGFIASLEAWSALAQDLPYALIVIDALSVLPGRAELRAPAVRAREILERVGARPLLRRLDEVTQSFEMSAARPD